MPLLWALLVLGCLQCGWTVNLQPQLASVTFATNNPTLTTVALEKPLCMFDSSEPLNGTYEVYLYAMVDSANSRNASVQDGAGIPLSSTFRQTQGGSTGPYKAAAFDLTPCSDLPSLDAVGDVTQASEILNAYLVRVGSNRTCLWDPNFQGLCNPPLSAATEYRFKYVLVNMSTGLVQEQTLWSDPIRTNQPIPYSTIDTWPGRRSGGMIVITSILGSLPFFLLVGFAGAIVLSFVDTGNSDGETTHDSQITQEAVPKTLETFESSYTSVNRGPSLDRAEVFSSKLQD
ncbi:uroplakin-3a isoform X1 [Nannospalax galili]|uniref:Uroplakin 3A n=1 Tax=Nannospalax galili TaxID=1026970 RepID=A0A8C6R7W0_NANGA|nr:uroplakin-3a isoform X1 [Nannospalax galili]